MRARRAGRAALVGLGALIVAVIRGRVALHGGTAPLRRSGPLPQAATPGPAAATPEPQRLLGAAWVGHGWVSGTPAEPQEHLLTALSGHGVGYFLVNTGRADERGELPVPPRLGGFLDRTGRWERRTGQAVRLLAWVAVRTDRTDLADPGTAGRLVASIRRIAESHGPVTGRRFDGVVIDAEPVGGSDGRFRRYLGLLDAVRGTLPAGSLMASAAPRIGPRAGPWTWLAGQFREAAGHADLLFVNAYNSGLSARKGDTPEDYRAWVREQTEQVLAAVAAAPAAGAGTAAAEPGRIVISLPAYPAARASDSGAHDPEVETAEAGALGVADAVARLRAAGSPAAGRLAGLALYAHTDGSGRDGYASFEQDWGPWAAVLSRVASPGPRSDAARLPDLR